MQTITPTIIKDQFAENETQITGNRIPLPAEITARQDYAAVYITLNNERSETVTVYKNTEYRYGSKTMKPAEINWAGCGSKSQEYTTVMVAALIVANAIAQEIDRLKNL